MKRNPRAVFGETLTELGKSNEKIVAVSCDSGNGGTGVFKKSFPERYIECGIMEQSAVSLSAGLAHSGLVPFIAVICPFLTMRAYEQIRDDIGFAKSNVKLYGTGAGLGYDTLGQSHETMEDIAVMRTIANLAIYCPADAAEVAACTEAAAQTDGPVYMRMPIIPAEDIDKGGVAFTPDVPMVLKEGKDALLYVTGTMVRQAVKAAQLLAEEGISLKVVECCKIKPLEDAQIAAYAEGFKRVYTLEEHGRVGGFGEAVAAAIASEGVGAKVSILAVPQTNKLATGHYDAVLDYYGISAAKVAERIKKEIGE